MTTRKPITDKFVPQVGDFFEVSVLPNGPAAQRCLVLKNEGRYTSLAHGNNYWLLSCFIMPVSKWAPACKVENVHLVVKNYDNVYLIARVEP